MLVNLPDYNSNHWWVPEYFYFAMGCEGQLIFVIPNKNVVLVFTSSLLGQALWTPYKYLKKYILPASQSTEALSGNITNSQRIEELTRDLQFFTDFNSYILIKLEVQLECNY